MGEPSTSSSDNSTSEEVRIYVKSPNVALPDDFSVLTTLDTSVASLKRVVIEAIPNKPSRLWDEKLIFRGRILRDNELVGAVLKNDRSIDHTFHLVVMHSSDILQAFRHRQTAGNASGSSSLLPTAGSSSTTASSSRTTATAYRTTTPMQGVTAGIGGSFAYDPATTQPPAFAIPDLAQMQQMQQIMQTMQAQSQPLAQAQQQQQQQQQHNGQNAVPQTAPMTQPYPFGYTYVTINGAPYLMPVLYPYQYYMQPVQVVPQQPQQQPAMAPPAPEPGIQDAARMQRRRQSFFVFLKLLGFVYLFSSNASTERTILIYLVAFVIFLIETGRLRIVRRRRRIVPNDGFAHQRHAVHVPQVPPPVNGRPNVVNPTAPSPSAASSSAASPSSSVASSSSAASSSAAPSSAAQRRPVNHQHNGAELTGNPSRTPPVVVTGRSSDATANGSAPVQQRNRRTTWRDVEHGLYTFIASLVPTNVPEGAQQDDVPVQGQF